MLPPEFRLHRNQHGLIVAGDLTSEETFELEDLWLRDNLGCLSTDDHLRLLDLYLRYRASARSYAPELLTLNCRGQAPSARRRSYPQASRYLPVLGGLVAVTLLFLGVI